MKTFWIYYGGNPVACVREEEKATDREVKAKALRELDLLPGVISGPNQTPSEVRLAISFGQIRA